MDQRRPGGLGGSYEDLKNGTEGDYRIKLAHIYFDDQTEPEYYAFADTGYCGNVVLADDTYVICGYGKFSPEAKAADGRTLKTYIISKRIRLRDTDALAAGSVVKDHKKEDMSHDH